MMKINKKTIIELTNKDLENLVKEYITKEGYTVKNINFDVIERIIPRDPVDRFDNIIMILDKCIVECE